MALTLCTEHEGTWFVRLHGTTPQEDEFLHGHHSKDFRFHKCSVVIILHQDSPIDQTL